MSYKDKDFLISVNSHNGKVFDYEVQDLNLLLENLTPYDFIQPETRNFILVDYIIGHNMDKYIEKFIYQLQENIDYEFISQYLLVSKNKVKFIKALNKYWTGSMVALISNENQAMTKEAIQDYIITSLANIGSDELEIQNQDDLVALFIMDKLEKITCEELDCKAIGESLSVLKIKFTNIDEQVSSVALRKVVYEKELYALNRTNVESILRLEYKLSTEDIQNRELTAVFSDNKQALKRYVNENISEFMMNVVLDNEIIKDDLNIAAEILNEEEMSIDIKKKYISLLSEPFKSLDDIDKGQWSYVLSYRKVVCNVYEIMKYYGKLGLTNELIGFINESYEPIVYSSYNDKNILNKFYDDSKNNIKINDERYKEIVQQVGKPLNNFNITGLSDSKVTTLIEAGLIPMNLQNLRFIRQYYPAEICIFVENNVENYLGLNQGSVLMIDEALTLLRDRKIDVESRKKIANQISTPISIVGMDYDDGLIEYILARKYNTNDMPYMLENYRQFPEDSRDVIYQKLKNQTSEIKTNLSVIAKEKELLWRIFEDTDIPVSEKSGFIDFLITNELDVDLSVLIQKMGFDNMTKLVSGDTTRLPQIKNGVDEKCLLTMLKKHGFVEDFSVDEDTNTIKVERKKSRFEKKM